ALANLDLIEDTTSMKQRVDSDDMAFSRKLAKVARNSPVMGQVENSDIIDFARKHNYLSKMLKLNDDG
ncbi:Kiwa anti-phage protein KwaB-like domain-containing protein, partial [Vibrio parahaemolyticus]